jgi:hypothetical protein
MLSTCDGRPGNLVTQYFSFFVQFGVAAGGASTTSLLCDALRDMDMTRSALGRLP